MWSTVWFQHYLVISFGPLFVDPNAEGNQRLKLVKRPTERDIFWDETTGQSLDPSCLLDPKSLPPLCKERQPKKTASVQRRRKDLESSSSRSNWTNRTLGTVFRGKTHHGQLKEDWWAERMVVKHSCGLSLPGTLRQRVQAGSGTISWTKNTYLTNLQHKQNYWFPWDIPCVAGFMVPSTGESDAQNWENFMLKQWASCTVSLSTILITNIQK